MADSFVARDGDLLVVSYPEVKIPIAKYAIVGVGGLTYTRVLKVGDDPEAEYRKVYSYLERLAQADARVKVKAWSDELNGTREVAPKPSAGGRS